MRFGDITATVVGTVVWLTFNELVKYTETAMAPPTISNITRDTQTAMGNFFLDCSKEMGEMLFCKCSFECALFSSIK